MPENESPQKVTLTGQDQERTWGMLCHLAALVGLIIPVGNILGPLVVWLLKKGEMPLVDEQGKEALNFQISMFLYFLVAMFLIIIFIGYLLLFCLAIADLVLVIIAAVKINNGEPFRYPLTVRFLK